MGRVSPLVYLFVKNLYLCEKIKCSSKLLRRKSDSKSFGKI
jgi:hypothetical protein